MNKSKKSRAMVGTAVALVCALGALFYPTPAVCANDAAEILKEVAKIQNRNSDLKVDLKVNGGKEKLVVGEIITFVVKTNRDCYLTLIHVDQSGKPVIVFPNKWTKSNFVKANQENLIPPKDSNFHFVAQEPLGVEFIKAIASTEPIEALQKAEIQTSGAFATIQKPGLVMKGLGVEMGRKQEKVWGTADVFVRIEPSK
jgi:hypothetical protein